jgi:hypothetical protein
LKFKQKGKWYLRSDCGGFTVTKALVENCFIYQTFKGSSLIGTYQNSKDAMNAARDKKLLRQTV